MYIYALINPTQALSLSTLHYTLCHLSSNTWILLAVKSRDIAKEIEATQPSWYRIVTGLTHSPPSLPLPPFTPCTILLSLPPVVLYAPTAYTRQPYTRHLIPEVLYIDTRQVRAPQRQRSGKGGL